MSINEPRLGGKSLVVTRYTISLITVRDHWGLAGVSLSYVAELTDNIWKCISLVIIARDC